MSSNEDRRDGFKKGKHVEEKKDFYTKLRGLVKPGAEKELFSTAPEERGDATISREGLKKLLYTYGQFLGIESKKLEGIIEGAESNGDACLAKLKFTYAQMCEERGFVPRSYKG